MSKLVHYYHVYAAGEWRIPVEEHLTALVSSGLAAALSEPVNAGIVGSPSSIADVEALFAEYGVPVKVIASANDGWEQLTIAPIEQRSTTDESFYVLYAHTKGAGYPYPLQTPWRQAMTLGCVSRWKEQVQHLDNGAGAAGCLWLTPPNVDQIGWGFYAGNFWWARSDALAQIPPLRHESRYDAEIYIGAISRLPDTECVSLFSVPLDVLPLQEFLDNA